MQLKCQGQKKKKKKKKKTREAVDNNLFLYLELHLINL